MTDHQEGAVSFHGGSWFAPSDGHSRERRRHVTVPPPSSNLNRGCSRPGFRTLISYPCDGESLSATKRCCAPSASRNRAVSRPFRRASVTAGAALLCFAPGITLATAGRRRGHTRLAQVKIRRLAPARALGLETRPERIGAFQEGARHGDDVAVWPRAEAVIVADDFRPLPCDDCESKPHHRGVILEGQYATLR